MKVLIYNPYRRYITQQRINSVSGYDKCRIVPTEDLFVFKYAFNECLSGETIVVFFIENETDMAFLEDMNSKFVDIKLIVNHPDENDKFRARILKLYPRFVTVSDDCDRLLPEVVPGLVRQQLQD